MTVFYNRQTVVYGKSGIGKSSLLHAGIFPEARLRGCLPVSIRFDHNSSDGYREQLIATLTQTMQEAGCSLHDLLDTEEKPQSLWEFFHRYQFISEDKPVTPLIVIDQFEEIFTLSHNRAAVQQFFAELADLLNDVMPDYLQQAAETSGETEQSSLFDNIAMPSMEDRYIQDPEYHLVIVLREDYLSYLERSSQRIPSLKQNRYGLMPLTYEQALEVILQPCPGLVDRKVADAIIRHIVTETEIDPETPVDSAILSLFLSRLYQKKGDADRISLQLVKEQGEALLADFYAEVTGKVDQKTLEYLEHALINADGHRENITLETLYQNPVCKQAAVEMLEANHLLRIFSYGNVQRVEFAHDVLCPIIMRQRSQRESIKRLRRSQRVGLLLFFAVIITFFGLLTFIANFSSRQEALHQQETRLSEMETSLIIKGAQELLDRHHTYNAIQLLINSMGDLNEPSESTVDMELVLRQAVDSLRFSENPKVGWANFAETYVRLTDLITLSPSKRLMGFTRTNKRITIIDAATGGIVQVFSPQNYVEQHIQYKYKYGIKNGIQEVIDYDDEEEEKITFFLEDIHPNDSTCLISTPEALMDCYILSEYSEAENNGLTRLCLHDFPAEIHRAAYSPQGDQIAVQLKDSSYLLYETETGKPIVGAKTAQTARNIFKVKADRDSIFEDGKHFTHPPKRYPSFGGREFKPWVFGIVQIYFPNHKTESLRLPAHTTIYQYSSEQESRIRNVLDSLGSTIFYLTEFTNSFYMKDSDEISDVRYALPMAISPDEQRVAIVNGSMGANNDIYTEVYGIYPHNGARFFSIELSYKVNTLYFTEDDQYLVVNHGEETEQYFYLPPLPQLVDTCRNMFFRWQMSDEDRYQTYVHMSDTYNYQNL
jgi:hypothetical protein